jgi:hypothetical protein
MLTVSDIVVYESKIYFSLKFNYEGFEADLCFSDLKVEEIQLFKECIRNDTEGTIEAGSISNSGWNYATLARSKGGKCTLDFEDCGFRMTIPVNIDSDLLAVLNKVVE